jgi:hypothetical protein
MLFGSLHRETLENTTCANCEANMLKTHYVLVKFTSPENNGFAGVLE